LAAFRRQDEEWKVKSEKRERERRQDFERDRQQHREIMDFLLGSTQDIQDIQGKLGFHDMRLAEQDSRVGDSEAQVTSLRIGLDGLENQVSSMELSRMADQGEFDSEESDKSAGFPAASKAKAGGVTFRPGQLRMEEHIQRVAAVEKQTERLTEAHAGQRDVMLAHDQQIGRLLSDVDVLSKQMNNYAVRVDEVEKDIEALKVGNPERASYVEARVDAAEGVI